MSRPAGDLAFFRGLVLAVFPDIICGFARDPFAYAGLAIEVSFEQSLAW